MITRLWKTILSTSALSCQSLKNGILIKDEPGIYKETVGSPLWMTEIHTKNSEVLNKIKDEETTAVFTYDSREVNITTDPEPKKMESKEHADK